MVFCLEHGEFADELVNIIIDRLFSETTVQRKTGLLYLISDILYNSSTTVRNASVYRTSLEV